ncbi:MAG: type III-B CRISPR module RAMP protein Cmr4 [Chloroflexota bacterium]
MATSLLYIYTESPLHAGTGSTVSVIDLPIQRERTTNYPHIYGSGLKGALRSQSNLANGDLQIVFGPDQDAMGANNAVAFAGAVSVGEAKLVLFPVRSLTGIFAMATCPFVLARLGRDLRFAGLGELPASVSVSETDTCLVAPDANKDGGVARSSAIVLEEYTFKKQDSEKVEALAEWFAENALPQGDEYKYWRDTLAKRLVVIPDDAFRDFVMYSTQIATRIRIQADTKTVAEGALWTQETLPPDALFVSTILSRKARAPEVEATDEQVQNLLIEQTPTRIQIGGDETTGHGMVALNWQQG